MRSAGAGASQLSQGPACPPGVTPGSIPRRGPAVVLGVPPSPPNTTSILRAREGIGFPPRPRRNVNSLSSSPNFPSSASLCPRLRRVVPAEGNHGGWKRLAPQAR